IEQLPESWSRHHAGLPPRQRRYVSRALDAVDGGEFPEEFVRLELVEDDLLARGGAHQNAHLARKEEIHVRRGVVEIDQGLAVLETSPVATRLDGREVEAEIPVQIRIRQPSHSFPLTH